VTLGLRAQSEGDVSAAQVPTFLTNQWAGMSPYSTRSVVSPGLVSPTHSESHSDPFPLNSNQRDVVWNASAGSMVQGSTSKKRIRREFGRMGRNIRQKDILYVFGFHVHGCVSRFTCFLSPFFLFFIFIQPAIVDKSTMNNAPVHCSRVPQITFFSNFFIKNRSHSTIYIFKNYFTTVLSISVFSFSKNKLYPNGPFVVSSKEKEIGMIKMWRTIGRSKARIKEMFRGVILLPNIIQMGKGKLAFNSFPRCHEDTELELQRLR